MGSRAPRHALPLWAFQVAAVISLLLAADAGAQARSCGQCHAELLAKKVVHPKAERCGDCHLQNARPGPCTFENGKGWTLKRGGSELCLGCHELHGRTDVHSTIRTSGCKSCHSPHASDHPKLLTRATAGELCSRCHEPVSHASEHAPVTESKCLACHNPHVGEAEPLLRQSRERLCGSCHDQKKLAAKAPFLHAPIREGGCLGCHRAHGSEFPHLLSGPGRCLDCHDARVTASADRGALPRQRVDLGAKVVHKPVAERCDHCHVSGHGSSVPNMLKLEPPGLCLSCHAKTFEKVTLAHSALQLGACPVCHEPHSGPRPGLLRDDDPNRLCARCHEVETAQRPVAHRPVEQQKCLSCHTAHGGTVPGGLLATERVLCARCHEPWPKPKVAHAAVERFGCGGCHDPHGAKQPGLLIRPVNELCSSCHPKQSDGNHVSSTSRTVHRVSGGGAVLDGGVGGSPELTCVSCHRAHGSDSPKLLTFGRTVQESCGQCHAEEQGGSRPAGATGETKGKGGLR